MLYIGLALSVLLGLLILYTAKWLIARLLLARRIQMLCRKAGLLLIPTRPCWMLGRTGRVECNFHLVCNKKIISVKLLSPSVLKLTRVVFFENGEYLLEYRLPIISFFTSTVHHPLRTTPRHYHKYRFDFPINADTSSEQEKVLMVCPPVCEVLSSNGYKRAIPLYGGESLNGELIYQTISHLEYEFGLGGK